MTSQIPRDEDQQPHDQLDSPGKRLRIARQAKGISQQDIATQLHLSSSIVQALEDDDHDRLPGPVFVRGYMRNYARLVGLDDNAVTNNFRTGENNAAPLSVRTAGVKPEIRSSHFAIRLMTWLIVLALIALLAAWWMGRLDWPTQILPAQTEDSAAPVVDEEGELLLPEPSVDSQDAVEPPSSSPQNVNGTAGSYTPPAETEEADLPTSFVESNNTEANSQPPVQAPSPEPLADQATPSQEMTTAGDPVETTPETATPVETTETAGVNEEEPAAAGDTVVFEFVGDCWVDIRDSTRNFKLFGEMKKGERHELGGIPPYSIILGNSPMVRVSIGDQAYDVEQHSRGNVARFTLDPTDTQ